MSHTPPPHLPYSGTYVLVHKYRSSPAGGYSVSLPLTLQLIPENFLASPGRKAKGVWKVLSKAIPSRNTKPVLLLLVLICIHLNKRCLVSNFSTHLFKHKSKMLANLGWPDLFVVNTADAGNCRLTKMQKCTNASVKYFFFDGAKRKSMTLLLFFIQTCCYIAYFR